MQTHGRSTEEVFMIGGGPVVIADSRIDFNNIVVPLHATWIITELVSRMGTASNQDNHAGAFRNHN
ncbi:hypothetical protein C5167_026097 [Papaver somniferum]|nr:hypothetical protein C5167_026097 [Papaver somniferum]